MDKTTFLNLAKSEVQSFEYVGETFYAKAFSVAARDALHPIATTFSGSDLDTPQKATAYREFRKKFVIYSLCDENGKQLLVDTDLDLLDDVWIEGIYIKISGLFTKKN